MRSKGYNLNAWGEFKDKDKEQEYQDGISKDLNHHNRVASLAAGIAYFTVVFADYAKLGFTDNFYITAVLRLLYLLLCVAVYLILRRNQSFILTRNLAFVVTLGNSILIISAVYFLNPDKQIDTIDQITVPVVTLLCYTFVYIPLTYLVINGVLATLLYLLLLTVVFPGKVDTTINMIAILGVINFMGFFLNRFLNVSKRKEYFNKITIENLNENLLAEVEERIAIQSSLEHALEQITDSIKYAQKIQFALLPGDAILKKNFQDSALFFQPKNIVSGDFYWVYEAGDKTIVAVADCTGHGIPGAFMSVLGISMLNDIVKNTIDKNESIESDEILNKLREAVILSLQQYGSNTDRRDGMDIALIVVDRKTKLIQFSGAYNPLWVINKNDKVNEIDLTEYKGDKMPIGMHSRKAVGFFSQTQIEFKDGDTLYLFSDGYKDQFGGSDGKKFLGKNMRELFINNFNLPLPVQQKIWIETFKNWKGERQQVDDILIMGIKL